MWKKLDGQLPPNHEVRTAGAHLHLFNVQFEDSGTYQCEAVNSKGKDYHTARLSVEGETWKLELKCSFILRNETNTSHFTVNDKDMTKQQVSTVILGKKKTLGMSSKEARGHSEFSF